MSNFRLTTPVALIIFNRPETTIRVFEEVRAAKPPKLLVVADGARAHREGEAERVEQARAIIKQVDWDCEVLTNYSEVNLGCRGRVSSGLDWVFETVEEAIVLEDDCLPHPTFFRFCQEMLERYRHDERVGVVAGTNFGQNLQQPYSYYFSRYLPITGWASWRRVWKHYDVTMKIFPEVRDNGVLQTLLGEPFLVKYWTKVFESAYQGHETTWDYQFIFAVWMQNMVNVISNVNLITNIGFGADATHVIDPNFPTANVPYEPMEFPLKHPSYINKETHFSEYIRKVLLTWSLSHRVKRKVKSLVAGNGH